MAKRFTDTQKYRKPFFRGLTATNKLFWDYLYHECDHAGVWIVDFEIAKICIGGEKITIGAKTLDVFNKDEERIIVLDEGKKWFIPSFVEFQYGILNSKNNAHKSVMKILKGLNIEPSTLMLQDEEARNFLREHPLTKEEAFEVKLISELPKDSLINVDRIANVYIGDKKLLEAVSSSTGKSVKDIKAFMPEFVENLQGQGKSSETTTEFAKYFRNWLKYQEKPVEKKDNTKKLDWSLISTQEKFTLDHTAQVALINKRMKE